MSPARCAFKKRFASVCRPVPVPDPEPPTTHARAAAGGLSHVRSLVYIQKHRE